MSYDYAKAAKLEGKADTLLRRHRRRIQFADIPADERHLRTITRIKRLMEPHWAAIAALRAGERLLSLYA